MVILLCSMLAVVVVVLLTRLESSIQTSSGLVKRRQAFYAADGVARAAMEVASAKLLTLPSADAATLADPTLLAAFNASQMATVQTELTAQKPTITPPGFQVPSLTIAGLGGRSLQRLTTGPFQGMLAQVQPFTINTEVGHSSLSRGAVAAMSASVQRGTLSMFQFFAFIDGYAYLYTGTGARFAGRVHANGNVCFGSAGGLYVEQITSAANFYLARSSGCRDEGTYHESSKRQAYIATSPLTGGLADLADNTRFAIVGVGCTADNSCPDEFDRDDTNMTNDPAATWATRATTRWNGQLQDSSHGVPNLKVPIIGEPLVQRGRNAQHLSEPNNETSRFLVDPILPAEPSDVRAQKLAFKADLRILNGVWYKRDSANPGRLGTPIWSDHPGNNLVSATEDQWVTNAVSIGQGDLFASAGVVPKRYSYYAYSGGTAQSLQYDAPGGPTNPLANRPVISYGTLTRESATRWSPGYYEMGKCGAGGAISACAGGDTRQWIMRKALSRDELLQATRSGFRDTWSEVGANRNDSDLQRENLGLGNFTRQNFQLFNMLPINFDVEAFAAAMADTTGGELGSHFGGGASFNGIVWIGATWPGQSNGYANTAAASSTSSFWPFQGTQSDVLATVISQPWQSPNPTGYVAQLSSGQPTTADATTIPAVVSSANNVPFQQALPYPLCAQTAGALTASMANVERTGTNVGPAGFQSATCARYQGGADRVFARPNAVRLHNGQTIPNATFPSGLTIATSLPSFVLGDYNSTSVPSDVPDSYTADASWRPALIAGDTLTLQSTSWEDSEAPWNASAGVHSGRRSAGATRYHMQVLAGWLVSQSGNRDEVAYFTRLTENWCSALRHVRGSVVIGFNSLYGGRFDWNGENSGDCPGTAGGPDEKIYAYDYNLDLPSNQPPGAPRFTVTAVERFRRN